VQGDFCPPIDWQDEDRSRLSERNYYIVTGRLFQQVLDANQRRVLQPYQARHFKDLLRQCDVHGPDHATPGGATSLMLAAKAGNAALVEALLAKGADPQKRDEFGHTAWDQSLARAMRETTFAPTVSLRCSIPSHPPQSTYRSTKGCSDLSGVRPSTGPEPDCAGIRTCCGSSGPRSP